MSVARQSQINRNAEFNDVIEHSRVMKQQNADRSWHHQPFDLLQSAVDITLPFFASWLVYPDQIKCFKTGLSEIMLISKAHSAFGRRVSVYPSAIRKQRSFAVQPGLLRY